MSQPDLHCSFYQSYLCYFLITPTKRRKHGKYGIVDLYLFFLYFLGDYYGLFAPIGSKCSIERENKTAPEKVYYCTKIIDIFAQSEVF